MTNAQEAVVRVRLDTAQAKRDLDGLLSGTGGGGGGGSGGGDAAGGNAGAGGGSLRRGFGLGLGVGIGAQLTGSSFGALGDVVGEAVGPIGANLSHAIFGYDDDRARGRATAREQTIKDFGQLARTNRAGAYQHFLGLAAIEEQKEMGASDIRNDPDFYNSKAKGGDFDKRNMDLLEHITGKVVGAIENGFTNIWNSIKSIIGV